MALEAYINQIAAVNPDYDMHSDFVTYMAERLEGSKKRAFSHLARVCEVDSRYSVIGQGLDSGGFYSKERVPTTKERMQKFEAEALPLARKAIGELVGLQADTITHFVVTTCTGFSAPGVDIGLVEACGLNSTVERYQVGYMGCHAALNGLKLANHIVRAEPKSRVLVINLELCTLHFRFTEDLETLISYLLFADGCAAAVVSADPKGIRIGSFFSEIFPAEKDKIQWHIGNFGFEMHLSKELPKTLKQILPQSKVLKRLDFLMPTELWAIHPGGKAIIDAVGEQFSIPEEKLKPSRDVLRKFGNMSSPTVMFVLKKILDDVSMSGNGLAVAFGPGVNSEWMRFHKAQM